jgi:hypothetical protein
MRKKTPVSLLAALFSLCVANSTLGQTVQYDNFSVPIYRYAKDQRFSDHQKIMYLADIKDQLGASLFPSKSTKQFNREAFLKSIVEQMTAAGIEMVLDSANLIIAIDIADFSAGATSAPDMLGNANYNITGSGKLALLNGKTETYFIKPLNLTTSTGLKASEVIRNSFTQDLATPKAIENYTLLVRSIVNIAKSCQEEYANSYRTITIGLPSVYRARKKYPELMYFDSLNVRLTDELKKKSVTDYRQMIVPYETELTAFMNREFPKEYDIKHIKMACYSDLAFLYYLAYDTVKMKEPMAYLYDNSTKFLGSKVEYDYRKPLVEDVKAYYASLNVPKAQIDSNLLGIQRMSDGMGVEKITDGWLVLEKGDTIRGKQVIQKFAGSIANLDANKLLFEYVNEKGKTVRKLFKYGEVKMLNVNNHVYESYKFKPSFAQARELSFDLLKARDYLLEVIYNSDKIKILKDNYGDSPSNAIVFIRPGEEEVANSGKEWNRNRKESMKTYFKDCPSVVETVDKDGYDWKTEEAYLKLAKDYSACH